MNEFWWGVVITLIVGIPGGYGVGLLANMHAPRVMQFLESRKLMKKHKTRQQALVLFNRIKDFREGRRDRYPYFILLASGGIISFIFGFGLILIVCLQNQALPISIEYGLILLGGTCLILIGAIFLTSIYETSRQLERFDDYKAEFEEKWGPG